MVARLVFTATSKDLSAASIAARRSLARHIEIR